eukprot:scaffold54878_cov67-Phaeocystis_antarctica.AAC.8
MGSKWYTLSLFESAARRHSRVWSRRGEAQMGGRAFATERAERRAARRAARSELRFDFAFAWGRVERRRD